MSSTDKYFFCETIFVNLLKIRASYKIVKKVNY
jgi:hypothetical protein